MYLVKNLYLQNVDAFDAINLTNGVIGFPNAGQYIVSDENQAELEKTLS